MPDETNNNPPQPGDASNQNAGQGMSGYSAPNTAGGAGYSQHSSEQFTDEVPLVDELGVQDLKKTLRDGRGRKFSSAGRNSPVGEFTDEFLVLHPPQKPFQDADEGPAEEIMLEMDASGVLVDEFGKRKSIPGAKFNGNQLFQYWQQKPGTLKHYVVWFDPDGHHHFLTVEGERITADVVYKLRNMTHDGELTRFKELTSE